MEQPEPRNTRIAYVFVKRNPLTRTEEYVHLYEQVILVNKTTKKNLIKLTELMGALGWQRCRCWSADELIERLTPSEALETFEVLQEDDGAE